MYQQNQMSNDYLMALQSYKNEVKIIIILTVVLCLIPAILAFLGCVSVFVIGTQNLNADETDLLASLGALSVIWGLFGSIGMLFYFVPTCIALCRSHSSVGTVFLLNIFIGWSVIGYIAVLIWSMIGDSFKQKYLSDMISQGIGSINNYISVGNVSQMSPPEPTQQFSADSQMRGAQQSCYSVSSEQRVTPIPYNQESKDQS